MDSETELTELLHKLKGDKFLTIFKSHDIDVVALKYMSAHHLDQVIPRHMYGPRIVFEHFLQNWQKEQSMEKETLMDLYTIKMETQNSSTFDSVNNTTNFDANNDSNMDAHSSSNMDVFNPIVPKIEKDDDDDLLQDMSSNPLQVKLEEYYAEESNSGNEYEEPKSSQPVTFVDIKSFPIEQILKESFNGEQIMDYYAENQTLNSKYRSMLGTCIVEYLVHNKLAPKRQQFGIIAENISDFFKNEDKDFYYLQTSTKRKPGGILYSKYHNYLQKLRKDGITELDFRPISMTRNFLFEINVPTIEEILQCSLNGKLLLEFYAKNGVLNAKHRPILSSCIIDYLIEKKLSPKREHFSAIADNIAQYFKSEDKDIYFTTPAKHRKPGGILYTKYHNQLHRLREGFGESERRSMNKAGEKRKRSSTTMAFIADKNLMEERDWLRNNSQPLQTVLEKWENTYNWRMSYIEEGHTLEEILEEWPLYRQNFGYKLFDTDFSKQHPNKTYNLFNKWEPFRKIIMCLLREAKDPECMELIKEFSTYEKSAEFNNCLIFYLIHAILKPTTRTRVYDQEAKKVKHLKSTKEDSRNAFMKIGTTFFELNTRLTHSMEEAQSNGETFTPILAGVGESMFSLREYYVYYGNVSYKFENILSSVDAAFKIYNVLNLDYPRHCKLIWHFIQEYFFEIKIPSDERSNGLTEILNDLRIRKV